MKTSRVLLAALLLGSVLGSLVVAGGTRGRNGGSGYACFPAKVDARRALDSRGRLRSDYIEKVSAVYAMENARYGFSIDGRVNQYFKSIQPARGASVADFLRHVVENRVKPFAPLYASVLARHLEIVNPEYWPDENLSRIDDSAQSQKNSDEIVANQNCIRVQLVERDAPKKEADGSYRYGFRYNRMLFQMLGKKGDPESRVLNQSFLIFQEAAYLMLARLGVFDGNKNIRSMIAPTFAEDYFYFKLAPQSLWQARYREDLRQFGLDKFFVLVSGPDPLELKHKARLQKSYEQLAQQFAWMPSGSGISLNKDLLPAVFFGNPFNKLVASPYPADLRAEVHKHYTETILPQLQGEEAFLLFADELAKAGKLERFEALLMPGIDDRAERYQVCGAVESAMQINGGPGYIDAMDGTVEPVLVRARHFCKQLEP